MFNIVIEMKLQFYVESSPNKFITGYDLKGKKIICKDKTSVGYNLKGKM